MADDDNVVKLPDALERRALRIEAAVARCDKSRSEWREGTLELAVELAGARDEFPANQDFGEWFDSRLGNVAITPHDRAALIQWGRDLDRTRKVLEKTNRISYRTIHDNEWVIPSVPPPAPQPQLPPMPPPQPASATPKQPSQAAVNKQSLEKAKREDDIRQGRPVAPLPLTKEMQDSINQQVRERAGSMSGLTGKARRSFEKTISVEMSKLVTELHSYKEKTDTETAVRIDAEVKRRLAIQLPDYEKRLAAAREREVYYHKLIDAVKVPLTIAEYNDVVLCCHPDDAASKDKRHTTAQMLNAKKFNLTGKK